MSTGWKGCLQEFIPHYEGSMTADTALSTRLRFELLRTRCLFLSQTGRYSLHLTAGSSECELRSCA